MRLSRLHVILHVGDATDETGACACIWEAAGGERTDGEHAREGAHATRALTQ